MRSTWDHLTPKQLHARACRVQQYARDAYNPDAFHAAEDIDDLLGGADPSEVEQAVSDARERVQSGSLNLDDALRQLSAKYRPAKATAMSDAGRKLESILRRALSSGESVASAAASLDEEDDLPSSKERERMRMQRDQDAICYSREHHQPMPSHLRYSRQEINKAGCLAAKRKISFSQAVQLLRSGR
jgi:hypothetical protein